MPRIVYIGKEAEKMKHIYEALEIKPLYREIDEMSNEDILMKFEYAQKFDECSIFLFTNKWHDFMSEYHFEYVKLDNNTLVYRLAEQSGTFPRETMKVSKWKLITKDKMYDAYMKLRFAIMKKKKYEDYTFIYRE